MPDLIHTPHELRRKRGRRKGDRMDKGGVCCTRPGKWGNPYAFEVDGIPGSTIQQFVAGLAHATNSNALLTALARRVSGFTSSAGWHCGRILTDIDDLRGKLLYCWCRLDQLCHVDVLASLANRPAGVSKLAVLEAWERYLKETP